MFDPLLLFAATTGAMGIAAVVAGRPVRGWPKWPLGSRGFRVAGAICLVESALAFFLAATRNDGIAFMVFSVGALSMAATMHVVQRRGSSI
jgi:hypothetical protein